MASEAPVLPTQNHKIENLLENFKKQLAPLDDSVKSEVTMVEYKSSHYAILSLHNQETDPYWRVSVSDGLQIKPSGKHLRNDVYWPKHHPNFYWPTKIKEKNQGVYEFSCFSFLQGEILIVRSPFCIA